MAIPLLIFEFPQIKKNFQFNRFALIIGSLIPDILDKALMFLGISSGRSYSHTLLFSVVSSVLVFLIIKRSKAISISFFIGNLLHLLLDLPDIPLFFPFISYDFIYIEDPFGFWFYKLLNDPFTYISEIAGLVILIFVIVYNKLFSFKKIKVFLFKNSKKELKIADKYDNKLTLE
ncbi:MAG: metal-dependent hydrolase [Candidatus Hermodarchaeota archaeon]